MAKRREAKIPLARSLAGKLVLGFLLIAAFEAVLLGGVSFYSLHRSTVVNRQLEEISLSLEATRSLGLDLSQVSRPIDEYLLGGGYGPAFDKFRGALSVVRSSLKSCGSAVCHGAAKEPQQMAALLSPLIAGVQEKGTAIFESKNPGQDTIRLRGEVESLVTQTQGLMDSMSTALSERVKVLRRESAQIGQRTTLLFFLSAFLSLGVTAAVAFAAARRFTVPARDLLHGTRRIMEGDLKHRVEARSHDEIGELADSFNAMVETLKEYKDRIEDYSRSLEEKVRVRTEELKKAQDSLLQSEKLASIGLLASGVAHELNNPLTSILMNINLLMEEAGDSTDIYRELKRISDDTLRCRRIIDDLRDFSRRHELDIRSSDINDLLDSTLGLVKHQLELHGISLHQDFSSDLPLISCDPDRLRQVLMNIFVNAIQAMPRGGSLGVKTALREGQAEIEVRDSGAGIPREIRSKVFDPFFTTKEAGTGLGLSIVYRIMEEHGGRIEVESRIAEEIGKDSSASVGTTIRLYIPASGADRRQSAAS